MILHQRVHPNLDVEGCFGCRISSVHVAPSATPTRRNAAEVAEINARQKRWDTDMPAYRRLRREGHQPPRIDGSATLEREAEHNFQIRTGHLDWSKEHYDQAVEVLGGHDPAVPITTPTRTGTEDT